MKSKRYFVIGAIILIFLSIKFYDDHRVKGLGDVIEYDINKFETLAFNEGYMDSFDWRTDQKEHAEKLDDFLSQYLVKKMKDKEWNPDLSEEKGFKMTIYTKGDPIIAFIYEYRLLFLNEQHYYEVVNGPIDINWVESYVEKFQQ